MKRGLVALREREWAEAVLRRESAERYEHERRALLVLACQEAREAQGIGLRDMGRRIGCSAAMLSDIERSRRWSEWIVTAYISEVAATEGTR